MADEPKLDPAQVTPGATVMTGSEAKPTEGTPAAEAPKAGDAKPSEGKKPEGAPEKYEAFKMPEGFTVADEARFGKFQDLAKTLNLSQEGAQKLIDLAIENGTAGVEAQKAAWEKTREGWVKEINTDAEIGGTNLPATTQYAKRALKEFGNDKLISFLNDTGFGDHPELVRAFARIGKKMSDDKFVDGKPSGTPEGLSAAEVIYGKK